MVTKERLLWKNYTGAHAGFLPACPCSFFAANRPTMPPSPTCFQGSDQPQSSQADFCDFSPRPYNSPPTWLPDYSAFELLGLTSHTPLQRSPAYMAGSFFTLNNLSKYILGIISENTFPFVINPVLDKRLMLNQCYIDAFHEKATIYNFSNSGQEADDVSVTSKQLPQGICYNVTQEVS